MQKDEYIKYIENFDKSIGNLVKLIDDTNYSLNKKSIITAKQQIKELIAQRVRPAVAMDGGDISFCSFDHPRTFCLGSKFALGKNDAGYSR